MDFAPPMVDSGSLHSSSERTMLTKYVARIEIKYDADCPSEAVTEINSKDNNLNQGFEAESAWLVCHYTSAPGAACITFGVWIQNKVDNNHRDLSRGVGRARRYVVPIVSPSSNDKVTEVRLLRSQLPIVQPPEGYSRISRNVNQGRGRDYLYLVWKTVRFDPIPIPDGIYVIRSKATGRVVELSGGNSGNEAVIWSQFAVPMEHNYFNQNWWIERVGLGNRYTIRNVRTSTYMDVAGGRSESFTRVQGYQKNDTAAQEWDIIGTDETGYSFFNVAAGTVLDLAYGHKIEAHSSHGRNNQIWFLDRRSFDIAHVSAMLNNCQYASDKFKYCDTNTQYMVCPEERVVKIWEEYKLDSRRQRKEYGMDHLAFAMKAAVADWAYTNIRTPVRLLFGVVFCTDDKRKHIYNWSLDQNLDRITFFDPQSGRLVTIPKYDTYSGVY